jgi:DNA-binding XRE family transcriptional regulator
MATTTRAPRPVLDATKIRTLRYHHGLTAVQLAEKVGVTKHHMYRLEAGAYGGSPRLMKALADTFGVTVADITTLKTVENTG